MALNDAKRRRVDAPDVLTAGDATFLGAEIGLEVESFLEREGVDEKAAEYLRNSAPEIQLAVMEQGSLAEMQKPSGALTARIRAAEQRLWKLPKEAVIGEAVEQFLAQEVGVDEKAAEYLRKASPMVQRAVVEQGGLSGARSPSGALTGRIRAAEAQCRDSSAPWAAANPEGMQQRFLRPEWMAQQFLAAGKGWGMGPAAAQGWGMGPTQGWGMAPTQGWGMAPAAGKGCGMAPAAGKGCGMAPTAGKACGMAPTAGKACGMAPATVVADDIDARVELFLCEHSDVVDDKAADYLRSCPADVKQNVLDQGGLSGTRNPSGALTRRIKNAMSSGGACGSSWPLSEQAWAPQQNMQSAGGTMDLAVEEFLAGVSVDDKAADYLRKAPAQVQRVVLDQGGFNGAQSPSASLTGRVKAAMQAVGGPSGSMGWANANAWMPANADLSDPQGPTLVSHEVENFLSQVDVDDKAKDYLRKASPEVQRYVLDQGGLGGAFSPSKALTGRINRAMQLFQGDGSLF